MKFYGAKLISETLTEATNTEIKLLKGNFQFGTKFDVC
jgi:hypothetical protein